MKKVFFKTVMGAGMAGMLCAGCANDIADAYDPNWIIQKYEAEWQANFGEIDPNHTWNTAVKRTADVTVGGTGEYTVKIYTANPRTATDEQTYLLARFDGVQGGGTVSSLSFDMPVCLQYIYAALIDADGNRMVKPVKLTDGRFEVSFGATAATSRAALAVTGTNLTTTLTDYWEYGKDEIEIPLTIVPEGENNMSKLTKNFVYESTGPFVVYPMYLVTANYGLSLGIYFENENGELEETVIWTRDNYVEKRVGEGEYYYWSSTSENTNAIIPEDNGVLRMNGIKVDIPAGTRFGFFITTNFGQGKAYSERAYNDNNECYGATFTRDGNLYLTFEDWMFTSGWETTGVTGSDADFNDLVCLVQGVTEAGEKEDNNQPEIVDKEDMTDVPLQYRIACEDLGGTCDFDFNDVVLGVEHVSGSDELTLTLLAAGGTLETTVSYNGEPVFDEVHAAFGVDATTMVNTGRNSVNAATVSKTIKVEDFSITTDIAKITITVAGRENIISVPDPSLEATAPQAFLVADPTWEWPEETQPITEKYPSFMEWVSDCDANNGWSGFVWETTAEEELGDGTSTDTPTDETSTTDYGTLVLTDDGVIPAEYFNTEQGNTLTIDMKEGGSTSFEFYACWNDNSWTSVFQNISVNFSQVTTLTITAEQAAQIVAANGLYVAFNGGRGCVNGLYIK